MVAGVVSWVAHPDLRWRHVDADDREERERPMGLPRELLAEVRRLDEYELRRLLILVRGLLLHADGVPEADEPALPPTLRFRQEEVRCGRSTCTRCPHGPYWYAYWREGGRPRKRYIGRHLPGEPLEPVVPDHAGSPAAPTAPAATRPGRGGDEGHG
jgi:hypothetical protein